VNVAPESIPELIQNVFLPLDEESRAILLIQEIDKNGGPPGNFSTPLEPGEAWAARVFLPSWTEVQSMIEHLLLGRVEIMRREGSAAVVLRLTEKGIGRLLLIRRAVDDVGKEDGA
jgi:hypothetical protein